MNLKLLIIIIFIFSGCKKDDIQGAKQSITSYLTNLLAGQFTDAYNQISGKDKNNKSIMSFVQENQGDEDNKYIEKIILSKIKYSIIKADHISDAEVRIYVSIQGPEIGQIIEDLMTTNLTEFSRYRSYRDHLIMNYKTGHYSSIGTLVMYTLIKEGDSWKISLGWDDSNEDTVANKWNKLIEHESKLTAVKDIINSLITVRELLYLNTESGFSKSYVKRIKEYARIQKRKQSYIENLELKNLKVKKWILGRTDWKTAIIGYSFSNDDRKYLRANKKGIFGLLKNNGDKTISQVELRFKLLDNDNKPVGEFVAQTINSSSLTSMPSKPLKTNHESNFAIPLHLNIPDAWGGKFDVTISDIKFSEQI